MDDSKLRELDERIVDDMESNIGCIAMFRPEHRFEYARRLLAAADAEAVPSADFCPHCSPCRNGERLAKAERLNIEYDAVLRGLASQLAAGGLDSLRLIDPKVAEEKIQWGIDHIIEVERKRAMSAAAEDAQPVAILHDDGCFTWKSDEFRLKYDRLRAGWRMEVFARQHLARDPAVLVEALKRIARGPGTNRLITAMEWADEALAEWRAKQ